jgi:hypothetical protein
MLRHIINTQNSQDVILCFMTDKQTPVECRLFLPALEGSSGAQIATQLFMSYQDALDGPFPSDQAYNLTEIFMDNEELAIRVCQEVDQRVREQHTGRVVVDQYLAFVLHNDEKEWLRGIADILGAVDEVSIPQTGN